MATVLFIGNALIATISGTTLWYVVARSVACFLPTISVVSARKLPAVYFPNRVSPAIGQKVCLAHATDGRDRAILARRDTVPEDRSHRRSGITKGETRGTAWASH